MPKTVAARALREAGEHRIGASNLTPAMQQTLAMLADIDSFHDKAHQRLERWPGPDVIKQRLSEQLHERRRRERGPLLRSLAELQPQIRSAMMFKARPVH